MIRKEVIKMTIETNELYKVIIKNGKMEDIVHLDKAKRDDVKEIDENILSSSLPYCSRHQDGMAISYNRPEQSEKLRKNIEDLQLPDGVYYLTMQYEHCRYGWAAGSNWYAGSICAEPPSHIDIIEGKTKAKDCIGISELNVTEIDFPERYSVTTAGRYRHIKDYNGPEDWLTLNGKTGDLEATYWGKNMYFNPPAQNWEYLIRPILKFDKQIDTYFCGEEIELFGKQWEIIQQDDTCVAICTEGIGRATVDKIPEVMQEWYEKALKEYVEGKEGQEESIDDLIENIGSGGCEAVTDTRFDEIGFDDLDTI